MLTYIQYIYIYISEIELLKRHFSWHVVSNDSKLK